MAFRKIIGFLLGICLCSFAQPPNIRNAKVRVTAAQPGLQAQIDSLVRNQQVTWIGYEVSATGHSHSSGCSGWNGDGQGCCGVYLLEDDNHSNSVQNNNIPVPRRMYVLLRAENGSITKVRPVMSDCQLDAGGRSVEWLNGVKAEDSIAMLSTLANADGVKEKKRSIDEVLLTIALHETPTATRALVDFTAPNYPAHLREQSAFWLGVERGHEGFIALQKLAQDADAHFREKITFDLSQDSDPGAVGELIRMAKSDSDSKVRGQALFWLAQKAGKKEASTISDAANTDPDREVKKKAVFALSQLPKDEGIPQLIHVAESNRDPEVRKNAIFWLGQTGDPRALSYLEQILRK